MKSFLRLSVFVVAALALAGCAACQTCQGQTVANDAAPPPPTPGVPLVAQFATPPTDGPPTPPTPSGQTPSGQTASGQTSAQALTAHLPLNVTATVGTAKPRRPGLGHRFQNAWHALLGVETVPAGTRPASDAAPPTATTGATVQTYVSVPVTVTVTQAKKGLFGLSR